MPDYTVPVFRKLKALPGAQDQRTPRWQAGPGRPATIPDSIVAAIRWDYEHGLMGIQAIAAKWHAVVSRTTVEQIAYGKTRRDVVAKKSGDVK